MRRSVLLILTTGFEEIEAVVPIDLLRRAGIAVIIASREKILTVRGHSELMLQADVLLDAVVKEAVNYDGLVLPGGPGTKDLRQDTRVQQLVRQQAVTGRLVAAICAAPLVLKDLGLLYGRRYTSHFSTAEALPERVTDSAVVLDGKLLTASGPGAAIAFGLAIITELLDHPACEKVAAAIDYPIAGSTKDPTKQDQ